MFHNFRQSEEQLRSRRGADRGGSGVNGRVHRTEPDTARRMPAHFETTGVIPGPTLSGGKAEARRYAFQMVSDVSGFLALEKEWNDLFLRAARPHHVFQSFNWCWHWVNTFLAQGGVGEFHLGAEPAHARVSLSLLTGRVHGRLIMVWPLVVTHAHGVRKLTCLGQPVTQYGDALVDDVADKTAILSQALDFLTRNARADVLSIWKVRDDANIASLLMSSDATETDRQQAPYLDLSDNKNGMTFEDYSRRKSAKAAKNLRRKRRRLEESGTVEFSVLPPDRDAVAAGRKAFHLKREWLKERGIFSRALRDSRTDRFFAHVVSGQVRPVGGRVSTLRVDGRDVAFEIAFACKGALAVHVISYDPAFARFGVGAIAMDASISACWQEGFHTYDLLAPGDSYKMDWADAAVNVRDYVLPLSRRGRAWIFAYEFVGKQRIKSLLNKTPVWVRRLVGPGFDLMRTGARRLGF